MEVVDRYLQAVKFWLPKEQRDDIAAELSEDIRCQIEEQESRLGRRLKEAEVDQILKDRGHPILAANRYLPQQSLIGPVLFPVYRFVLKIVFGCFLTMWLLTWLGMMTLDSSFRATHGWMSWIGPLFTNIFVSAGLVTLIFAVLERTQVKPLLLEKWEPGKLPPVRDPNAISRFGTSIELAANLFFLVWFGAHLSSTVLLDVPNLRITLSPQWHTFFWAFLLLTAANTALAGVNLIRPRWTPPRAVLRLLGDLLGSALFAWFLRAGIVAGIAVAGMSPQRAAEIANAINLWMARGFPFAILLGIVIAATDAYRIRRVQRQSP